MAVWVSLYKGIDNSSFPIAIIDNAIASITLIINIKAGYSNKKEEKYNRESS